MFYSQIRTMAVEELTTSHESMKSKVVIIVNTMFTNKENMKGATQ
jgi:hypothetical protein